MSHKITENEIEHFAIELLIKQGFEHIYAPDIAPDSEMPMRDSFEEVILKGRLQRALAVINPTVSEGLIADAVKQVERLSSADLVVNNEAFHRMLTEGIKVEGQRDGVMRGEIVWLVDFKVQGNNDFVVCNQLTVIENGVNKRPDLILFVNGLPLVVIELKNPVVESATIGSAYQQIQTYKSTIPSLFTYNAFCIISDGLEAKSGTISAGLSRFMAWKSADGKREASRSISQVETMITGMLQPAILLDLVRNFIVYERGVIESGDITTIKPIKKIAAYHQYYAVNKAVESTLRAVGVETGLVAEAPATYHFKDVKDQPVGDRKAGVVWHTQGSGKSLSMVFYAGKIVLALNNPTILVLTDRNDLDDQLFDTFANSASLLRQEPVQASNRVHLKKLLSVASGGVIFATIQKFQTQGDSNIYEQLSPRKNIIVLADEAHRTQYGFKAKTVDDRDKNGRVIGKKTVYGFAKYLRDALPNATYLGFTGTPIESTDVNTPAVFGDYVDVYDILQAVEDGATVKIYYESRLAKINLSDEGRALVKALDVELQDEDLSNTQKAKAKWTQLEALIGSKNRIKEVANDIITHFEARQTVFTGKGMVVAMSRRIAAELYKEIIALKPEWHSDALDKGVIKVVMTASSSDGATLSKHHTNKQQRRDLANRMKDANDELKLVIVRDMWLTGFDAPSMHTLYIDKPMQGHNLMQAIARVNRVYKDKPAGLVVDYLGIASDLKKALSFYSDSGGKGNPVLAQEQAVALMLEKLEVVSQMYHGFAYKAYFQADTRQKLCLILEAEEHILGLEKGKKRYINEVTALSQAFAIAVPHDEAMEVKEEISFFQAVKARLVKFTSADSGRTDAELETTIKQVIDQALVTDKVVDIFDASGIKKPDISILSDEFLQEVQGMKHKNIALEVLKKLLNDDIKSRSKTNLIQSETLTKMLEKSIQKYHNKIITAVEVIEELISLSKDISRMDKEPEEMGLSDFEYAFYSAIASNDSAKEVMEKEVLRELAVVLTEKVRSNTAIDWNIKTSARSKLKVIVKRTLRQFGYPPDRQKLATETVLKQAELIADELTAANYLLTF